MAFEGLGDKGCYGWEKVSETGYFGSEAVYQW